MSTEIRDCIPPDRNPRKPSFTLPSGAVDTHVHVFEDKYALSPARGYNPPESTLDDLKQFGDHGRRRRSQCRDAGQGPDGRRGYHGRDPG